MKKLNIRGSVFLSGVWSYTWRWTLILLCMSACCYWINQLIGFHWWLIMEKSGAVKIIFGTVVIGVLCAFLQVLVGVLIYQFGRKKLIDPLHGVSRMNNMFKRSPHEKSMLDVLGNPIRDMFGQPITEPQYFVPFPWKPMTCGWDSDNPAYKGYDQYVLMVDPTKKGGVDLLLMAEWRTVGYKTDNRAIGWCWSFELLDWLRTHSVVIQA